MQLEDVGTDAIIDCLFTVVDRFINLATNGSHSKGIVVGANMIPKGLANVVLNSEQLVKLRRHRMERWQDYLSTEAAHAKPGIYVGGHRQMLSHPMKGMAVGTLNIHSSQMMDWPSGTKWLTCRRQKWLRWWWWQWWWWWWKLKFFQYHRLRSKIKSIKQFLNKEAEKLYLQQQVEEEDHEEQEQVEQEQVEDHEE
jgi:hypothetical protein